EAVAAAGHEVRPLALFEADNADSAFRLPTPDELRRAVAAVGPDLVVLGNLHAANAEPRYAEAATAAAPTLALLHDFWWLTGRCAYPEACESYRAGCHAACPTPHEYPALAPERIADAWRAKRQLVASPRGPYLLANSAWAEGVAAGALAGGDGAGRVGRVQLSVPTELFRPQDRGAARRALGLPEERFVVLLTGNLYDRRKRVAEALEALAALALPDLTVVALGPAAADERFAVADVRRPGWIGDPAQLALYYAAADLFVAPSVDETFGQAYVEAAACGTPAIGYRRSGVAEAVRDGVTGVLLDEVSPAALAAAIERLHRDPARRAELGALGRLYVENEWSPEASYRSLFLELHRLGIADELGLAPKIAFPARPAEVSPVRYLDRPRTAESGVLPVGALSWRRRWRHLVRRLREALSALAPSPGRAAGKREPVYRASRRDGIDFRRPGRPSFVAAFRGLSFVEPWGRWTDGPRFEVHFRRPLPRRLRVVVAAGALGENARLPIRVAVGDASGELRIPLDPLEAAPEAAAADRARTSTPPALPEHVMDLDTSGEAYVLSIDVPSPTSPAMRWSGASSDTRRLGLALQRLRVESR
ncbi:MAG: glycosyltransferase, partial [Thermoanaerobaculia bacterium]|nr:glycosyltransferase [Thermoanaerobaculia bacterium]